jgi:uncharacterized protein
MNEIGSLATRLTCSIMPSYECPTCHARVTCDQPEQVPFRPFCSARCKLIDLERWFNEEYRVSEEIPETQQEEDAPPPTDDLPGE